MLFGTLPAGVFSVQGLLPETAQAAGLSAAEYGDIETVSWLIAAVGGLFALASVGMVIAKVVQILKKERSFRFGGLRGVQTLLLSLALVAAMGAAVYFLPSVFLNVSGWEGIEASYPPGSMVALYAVAAAVGAFYLHFLLGHYFVKPNERPMFTISTFSVLSGVSYAFVMFIVNTALGSEMSKLALGGYFVLGLAFYVFGQMLVRTQLTKMTNNMLYTKRVELVGKILKTPYYKLERVGKEKIYTSLNNDTETISSAISLIVIGITSSVTILTSFVYLAISSMYGLLTSFIMVAIAGTLLVLVNRSANRKFNLVRDTQNVFFKFIDHLIGGFKELYLNKMRRREFEADMVESCDQYREKRIEAELVSANVYFVGELLAFIVLGGLVFLLPTIIAGIGNATLSDYVLVFLFLKGPLDNVLNMIPRISQIKVSWGRINEIAQQVAAAESDQMDVELAVGEQVHLELRDVEFRYPQADREHFSVGPVSCEFASGEIVFITGGNGSGKSTLAKLISGLYAPDKGGVTVNGEPVRAENLGQLFSTVFTDYFLFEKLYGISYQGKEGEMERYLELLGMSDKVSITDGIFSTTKLSTGQKKRLALLISYLEDRPIYLFDEWAADQDPEFRQFFYQELLPEMKAQGKCVIAITHDDRYFDLADKVIKMEAGRIQQEPVLAV